MHFFRFQIGKSGTMRTVDFAINLLHPYHKPDLLKRENYQPITKTIYLPN